jgi:hypothetical protein
MGRRGDRGTKKLSDSEAEEKLNRMLVETGERDRNAI